ncbi:hypothetical protein GF385_01875 [Candidatus Dependentiae bacterium]|nr:hypothetical protein [Candidatus Dependentiae bacterium]
MKKIFIALFFLVNLSPLFSNEIESKQDNEKSKKEVVDEIKARVNGVNITKSLLEKPQAVMGGKMLTLEDAITNELLFQKAKDRKLLATAAEVDKQITNLKIHNGIANLTDEEMEEELKTEGLTFQEYKNQMARFIAIERLKGAEYSERVVVTEQEIKNYYKDNPSWLDEKYLLNICELEEKDVDEKGNIVKKDDFKWDNLGWIKKDDLSSDLLFVSSMKKGQVSNPVKMGNSYQVVKVVDRSERRLKSLEERRNEIQNLLQEEKRAKFAQDFEKELRSDASIVYLT